MKKFNIPELLKFLREKVVDNSYYDYKQDKKGNTVKGKLIKQLDPITFHLCYSYQEKREDNKILDMYLKPISIVNFLDEEDLQYFINKYCSEEALAEEKESRVKEYEEIISNIEKEYLI